MLSLEGVMVFVDVCVCVEDGSRLTGRVEGSEEDAGFWGI